MAAQRGTPCEAVRTEAACKGSLTSVHPHVIRQIPLATVHFRTSHTRVAFLNGLNPLVDNQVALPRGLFSVAPDAVVCPLVNLKVTLAVEGAWADLAGVVPLVCVRSLMHCEVTLPEVALPAEPTGMQFPGSMLVHVNHQVHFPMKDFQAESTSIGLRGHVQSFVSREVAFLVVALRTEHAGVGPLSSVRALELLGRFPRVVQHGPCSVLVLPVPGGGDALMREGLSPSTTTSARPHDVSLDPWKCGFCLRTRTVKGRNVHLHCLLSATRRKALRSFLSCGGTGLFFSPLAHNITVASFVNSSTRVDRAGVSGRGPAKPLLVLTSLVLTALYCIGCFDKPSMPLCCRFLGPYGWVLSDLPLPCTFLGSAAHSCSCLLRGRADHDWPTHPFATPDSTPLLYTANAAQRRR